MRFSIKTEGKLKHKILLLILTIIFISCEKEKPIDVNQEKEEVIQFLKDYTSFINKNSIEDFEVYWRDEPDVSYIALERDTALVGFNEIRNYFEVQFKDVSKLEYSTWNPVVWVNKTKSEALVVFNSSKNIQFKNGFNLNLSPIRNSALLNKFEGKWKLISLHESVRQK